MPLNLQVHLLRVLENRTITRIGGADEQKIDVRVIAATNRDPKQAVADGRLREDLYYRLIDFPLTLPALRERGDDVNLLAHRFLERLNARYKSSKTFAEGTDTQLRQHNWPGNIRELKHVVQRSYILGGEEVKVQFESAPGAAAAKTNGSAPAVREGGIVFTVGMTFEEVERQMLTATLEHFGQDKAKAAAALGISVKTIYNRLKA
jgi:transcriptional regulator with PAS, ATPase and Fis domain